MAVDVSVLPLTVFELWDAAYVRPSRWVLESHDCQSMMGNSSSPEASDHKSFRAALLCMSASFPQSGFMVGIYERDTLDHKFYRAYHGSDDMTCRPQHPPQLGFVLGQTVETKH